jgi:hypothetical protein
LKLLLPAPASEVEASVPKEFSAQLKWLYQKAGNHKCAQQPKLPPNRLNMQEWRKRLAGSTLPEEIELLDYLENGIDLGVSSCEFPSIRRAQNLPSSRSAAEKQKLMDEIVKEVALGRVAGPFHTTPLCFPTLQYSPIGSVPKKGSNKLRMIFHLSYPRAGRTSSINSLISESKKTCSLLRFTTAVEAIYRSGRGSLLAKFDINEAYRYLRVRKEHQVCLGFTFLKFHFVDLSLPFGLSSGPRIFELLSTAIERFAVASTMSSFLCHFIDDYLLVSAPDLSIAKRDTIKFLDLVRSLGVSLSASKLVVMSTSLEFLGILIDTVNMRLSIPEDKLKRYRKLIHDCLVANSMSWDELNSLIGVLVCCASIVPHSRPFYGRLRELRERNRFNYGNARIKLDEGARLDLDWWNRFIVEWNGRNILAPPRNPLEFPPACSHILFTDASSTGAGAWLEGDRQGAHRPWSQQELVDAFRVNSLSLPYLEFLAVTLAVFCWRERLRNSAVLIRCDNSTVVEILNSDSSHHPELRRLLRLLILIASRFCIVFFCLHIRSEENVHADFLSRHFDFSSFVQFCQDRESSSNSSDWRSPSQVSFQPLPEENWQSEQLSS